MSKREVILIDGGLSTELDELGFELNNEYRRLWTGNCLVKDPNVMKQAHMNFLNSGCDVITTSSYQMSIDLLTEVTKCSQVEAKEFIKKSVYIAIEARKETNKLDALIAGSVGPYGACLCDCSEYDGSYANNLSLEFMKEWHRLRLECLLEANCDLIAIETIPSIKEADAILSLLSEYPNIKAWLSFSCKDEKHICNGDNFADAYQKFKNNTQLVAIGINCSSPSNITGLLSSVDSKEETSLPFIVYPNLGSDWNGNEWIKNLNKNEQNLNDLFVEWIRLGAKFIGGCCNFSSKRMKQIREILDKL